MESINDQIKATTMTYAQQSGKKLPQYLAALSATLGALAAGTVLGFTSPTEDDYKKNSVIGSNIEASDFKWVGALAPLGCLAMCIPAGFVLNIIGRKITMLLMVIVFTVGWALIIWANNITMLFIGRFLTGMAGGTFCVAAPLYTSEISEKDVRGTLGSYFQLMITVGILYVYVSGYFLGPKNVAISCIVIPFVFFIAFVFMPESPVYALKKGNEEKARKSLQWLRGSAYNVDNEIAEIKAILEEDKNNPVSIKDSLKKKATKKGLALSFGLMFFQQMSGINAVIFYSATIFEDAGSSLDPKQASIIVGAMQVLATFVSSLVIDRLGRRILLLLSAGIMGVCAMLLGIYFNLNLVSVNWLPILALIGFIVLFSMGFGPIPWMFSSEVLPREIKTTASAGAGMFNWFLTFLITLFYGDVSTSIGTDITFFIFMAICIIGVVFIFFIVPETKGKTLEEIQDELEGITRKNNQGIVNEGFVS